MKSYFIEAKSKLGAVNFNTDKLPKKIGIVTTVQHLGDMRRVVDYLWKHGVKAVIAGQVLGCDSGAAVRHKDDVNGFLYIGSGEFHPIGVALQTGKQVWVLQPGSKTLRKIDEKDIDKIRRKKKGMLLKFHSSKKIGVLMTTKHGQSTVQGGTDKVTLLEKKFPHKKFYYFLCDTLNYSELDNFNFIDCWLNTMCPRVVEDINVLNLEDLV